MSERKPTVGHRIEYAAWRGVGWTLKLVPRPLMVFLADTLGILAWDVLRVRRRVVEQNLAIAFGDTMSPAERHRVGRRSFQNSALTFFEFLQPEPLFAKNRNAFARVEGVENARPWFGGKAAVMVTGHIGNWEAMACLLDEYDVNMVAAAKPMHNPLVQKQILAGRARYSRLSIVLTKSSMKAIVDATRAGKWAMLMADQDARANGIFVDFFGRAASTAVGPALFAWKLNLPLMPVFCVRERSPGRPLVLIMCPPIHPDPEADRDEEVRRLTEAHTKVLEEVVRRYPADYFWLHRRWKTRPEPPKT